MRRKSARPVGMVSKQSYGTRPDSYGSGAVAVRLSAMKLVTIGVLMPSKDGYLIGPGPRSHTPTRLGPDYGAEADHRKRAHAWAICAVPTVGSEALSLFMGTGLVEFASVGSRGRVHAGRASPGPQPPP
jgi:hypothetical protein